MTDSVSVDPSPNSHILLLLASLLLGIEKFAFAHQTGSSANPVTYLAFPWIAEDERAEFVTPT